VCDPYLLVLSVNMQVGLQPEVAAVVAVIAAAVARNGSKFFQCNVAW
jgi:hypothetical protein